MTRPFDISNYILDEIFKTNHKNWPAGAFDYQLRLNEMPKTEIDTICEWLSLNCNKNYIVSMETLEILSGGTTNNKLSWRQRHKRKKKEISGTIKVRLDKEDVMLFRMVWVS